jgi:thiol-disulfide isomerase/thioredoxin
MIKSARLTLSFVLLLSSFIISAQDGYQVNFRIRGLSDTTCLIANYYGNGTYIRDTLQVDAAGRCVFKAGADLPKGIYILVINDKNYFDFIINNDKKFRIETDRAYPMEKMTILSSPENKLFYEYLRYNKQQFDLIQSLQNRLKSYQDLHDSSAAISARIKAITKAMIEYKLELVKKNPSSFLAFLINAMKEPDFKNDTTFSYQEYKMHFWDGTDFSDDRLLRTPVFYNKLKKYFDQVLIQQPDTIIQCIDSIIIKAKHNQEIFRYIIGFVTYHYESSEIMGFDKIFVDLVDKYYITGEVTWLNQTMLENIIKKANRLRPILIGHQSPNMIMQDTSNQLVSMANIRAKYLILLFWDPDCGHCEQEIPKLRELYNENKAQYGLELFAVCSDTSLTKWKNAIRKKNMNWINVNGPRTLTGDYHEQYDIISTPVIYILNERKEIIAKRLSAEQVLPFLENYTKIQNQK